MHDFHRATQGLLSFIEPRECGTADLPLPISALLDANKTFSIKFVSDAEKRQAWHDDHAFQFVGRDCIDGRRLCAEQALGEIHGDFGGVPPGIIEIDRSSGNINGLDSLATCFLDRRRAGKGRPIMLCETAHHSSRMETTASCAALGNDTAAGLRIVSCKATEANYVFRNQLVAFHALADTDDDSLMIFGDTSKSLNTAITAADSSIRSKNMRPVMEQELLEIFPTDWPPLAALKSEIRRRFVPELAELLAWNAAYVRRNARKGALPKLKHEERIIVIGRQVEPLSGTDAFLCDDHSLRFKHDFRIAFRFVALNSAIDAAKAGNRDWTVPCLMNEPCDDDDERLAKVHVRHSRIGVEAIAKAYAAKAADFILNDPHGLPKSMRPRWLLSDLEHLGERLCVCTTSSNRRTRLLIPFV
jgi:hypothetical protein